MKTHLRTTTAALATVAAAALLTLTACGSSDTLTGADADPGASGSASAAAYPTTDVAASVTEDAALHNKLPASVKSAGSLSVGYVQSPGTSFLPQAGQDASGKDIGIQTDLLNAIGKELGVSVSWQPGEFAALIAGVGSKYDLGEGNFALLSDRLQTVDQVSYLIDGQSFLGRAGLSINKVTSLTDVCGLKITTGTGSSFQAILQSSANVCKSAGKPDWKVTYIDDGGTAVQSLLSGQEDVYFGPSTSVSYIAEHVAGLKDLGEVSWTNVGYAVPKRSPLGPVLADAINELIKNGTYGKIFQKSGIPQDEIKKSQVVTAADASDTSLVGVQTRQR